jgi:hypothetical protein
MKKILLFLSLTTVLYSCKKNCDGKETEATGIIKDYTGKLDGCTMLIELTNGTRLEVRSLPAGVTLMDGRTVSIKYRLAKDAFSVCMAGQIADITRLRYL